MLTIYDYSDKILLHLLNSEEMGEGVCVPLNQGSVCHRELMSNDYIRLKFSLAEPIEIKRGAHLDYNGRDYVLCKAYYPNYNQSTGGYDYDIQLDAWYYNWNRYILKLNSYGAVNETTFSHTSRLGDHCQLIADALAYISKTDDTLPLPRLRFIVHLKNGTVRTYRYEELIWTASEEAGTAPSDETNYVEDEAKGIEYKSVHIVDALTEIAKAFETEWWMEEGSGVDIHFGRCEQGSARELCLTDKEDNELQSLSRSDSTDNYATRIYAYGSERNVPKRYKKSLIFTATEYETLNDEDTRVYQFNGCNPQTETEKFAKETVESAVGYFYTTHTYNLSVGYFQQSLKGKIHLSLEIPIIQTFGCGTPATDLGGNSHNPYYAELTFAGKSVPFTPNEDYSILKVDTDLVLDETTSNGEMLLMLRLDVKPQLLSPTDSEYTAQTSVGVGVSTTKVISPNGKSSLVMRDGTRKMKPDYFAEENRNYESGYTKRLGGFNGSEAKQGSTSFREIGYISKEGNYYLKVTVDLHKMKATEGAELTLYAQFKTSYGAKEEMYGGSKMMSKLIYNGGWHNKNKREEEYSLSVTTYLTVGDLSMSLEYEQNGNSFKVSIEDISVEVMPRNAQVDTTLTILSCATRSELTGTEIPCILNEFFRWSKASDESYSWLSFAPVYQDIIETLVSDLATFKLSGVMEYQTPLEYFTEDYKGSALSSYNKRLMLPDTEIEGYIIKDGYIQCSDLESSQIVETEVIFEDIYPSKELTIVRVDRIEREEDETDDNGITFKKKKPWYRFYINKDEFPFNNNYKIKDENISCVFTNSNISNRSLLLGMTFELEFEGDTTFVYQDKNGVSHPTQSYVITKREEKGLDLPNDTLKPLVGDTVVMINYDPTAIGDLTLVKTAEEKLIKAAKDQLKKVSTDVGTYNAVLASDYAYANPQFRIGDRVTLKHKGFFGDGERLTRVIGYEIKLDIPYDAPQYTIGESSAYSRLSDLESKIEGKETSTSSITTIYGMGGETFPLDVVVGNRNILSYTPSFSKGALVLKAGSGVNIATNQDGEIEFSSYSGDNNALFELVTLKDGTEAIRAKYSLFTEGWLSAFGIGQEDSSPVIDLLRDWGEYTTDEEERERALSAYLGNKLKSELAAIDTKVNNFDGKVKGLADVVGKLNKRIDDLDLDSLDLTKERLGHWDDAYSWGNHADVGYAKEKDVKSVADRLDDMFTKVTLKDGTSAIRANYGLFSVDFISAYGVQTDNGLDTEGDTFVRSITFSGGKLHVHYGKVGVNAETIETIDNKIDAVNKRIDGLNLDSLGLTAERIGHWDSAYNFVESISGTTPDAIINTWEEIKAFVQGLDGSSTLEQILATKFDKNDFTKENILGTVGSLYWADIVVSDKSSTQTTPTFKSVKIGSVTISDEDGHLLIDKGLVSKDFISAFGLNSEQGGGGADLSPDTWTNSSEFANNLALSANLGWSLHTDIETLKTKATNVSYRASVTSGTTLGTLSIDGKDNTIYAPSITSSAITTALGYTPFDKASFTKANIKSTLGIAEWALAANAPTCVTSFGTKTGAVTVRGGLTANGSVNLSMSKNELQASIVGLGGAAYKGETYYTVANSAITGATKCKITYDSKGLVTSGDDLSESDIPNLGISKIKNLQTTLDTKLDKTTFNDLFEKKEISSGVYAIRVKYSMYSDGFISAFGINSEQGGGADLSPDTWTSIGDFTSDMALSANLGWSLHADVENLKVHCNADTVDGFHFARKTQSEYNSMTKDSKTVYFIIG